MKKPKNTRNAYCGLSMVGTGPFIWISSQGTSERLSPSEAIKLGERLIDMAKYIRSTR